MLPDIFQDLVITIPAKGLDDWLRDIDKLKTDPEAGTIYYRCPSCPQHWINYVYCVGGGRFLGVHAAMGDGRAVHWPRGFRCDITGIYWEPGWYIARDPKTWLRIDREIPFKSFRGYRYLQNIDATTRLSLMDWWDTL